MQVKLCLVGVDPAWRMGHREMHFVVAVQSSQCLVQSC